MRTNRLSVISLFFMLVPPRGASSADAAIGSLVPARLAGSARDRRAFPLSSIGWSSPSVLSPTLREREIRARSPDAIGIPASSRGCLTRPIGHRRANRAGENVLIVRGAHLAAASG